jgi:hypothetical protein
VHAVVGAKHAPGDLPDLLQLDGRVIGQLPAPVPGNDPIPPVAEWGDEYKAVTSRVDGQHLLRRLAESHVGQHDRLYGGVTRVRQGEGLAHFAVHPIGTDGVHCPPRAQGPVLVLHVQLDSVGVLAQIDHLRTTHDLRPERAGTLLEHSFSVVLRGHQHIRESGG